MAQDFDFLIGSRKIHNLYLKGRLRGSTEWIEFEGRSRVESLLDGEFFGTEDVDGKNVICRFRLIRTDRQSPRWEQSFSADGGKTWETNWIMTFINEDQQWGANCAPSSVL
jgi:hypothetical protein